MLRVGVLAVQGAFLEHETSLQLAAKNLGIEVDVVEVRKGTQLAGLSGIILPGGESTTISRLLRSSQTQEPLLERAGKDLAVLGTCAGLILLCSDADHDVANKDIQLLGLLDATVDRNAFGRQRESFELDVQVDGVGPVHGVFIRAPSLVTVRGDTVQTAVAKGRIVGARNGLVQGVAFHPELTPDTRMHEAFLQDCLAAQANSN